MDSAMIASLLSYGNIAIKLAVGLIGFLWVLRTTNRCQLAQMTPVDLIGNFVMGGIIGGHHSEKRCPQNIKYTHNERDNRYRRSGNDGKG